MVKQKHFYVSLLVALFLAGYQSGRLFFLTKKKMISLPHITEKAVQNDSGPVSEKYIRLKSYSTTNPNHQQR